MTSESNFHSSTRTMSRREFTRGVAGIVSLAHFGMRGAFTTQTGVSAEQARDIYHRAIVIDALANPSSANVPLPPPGPLDKGQLNNVINSGLTAINVTVSGDDVEGTLRKMALWQGEVDAHPSNLQIIRRHSDIEIAKREGRLGLILGFQGAHMIGHDPTLLDVFYKLGVRIVQLTYNARNLLGDGCLEPANAGLSNFGLEVVRRLNGLRAVVDLSHAGSQTTADAIAASTSPVIISHTGCRAVYRHPRNQEDRELKALADRGGVVGIYLMPFLGGERDQPPTADLLLRHIEHALQVCGTDHVGIGSDLSITPVEETPDYLKAVQRSADERKKAGISAPREDIPPYLPELNKPRRLEMIAVAMAKRGHSSTVIEKVIGGNFYRVFRDIWGDA